MNSIKHSQNTSGRYNNHTDGDKRNQTSKIYWAQAQKQPESSQQRA